MGRMAMMGMNARNTTLYNTNSNAGYLVMVMSSMQCTLESGMGRWEMDISSKKSGYCTTINTLVVKTCNYVRILNNNNDQLPHTSRPCQAVCYTDRLSSRRGKPIPEGRYVVVHRSEEQEAPSPSYSNHLQVPSKLDPTLDEPAFSVESR